MYHTLFLTKDIKEIYMQGGHNGRLSTHCLNCNLFATIPKLLEKVFPIMSTFLHNKTIFKRCLCGKKSPSPSSLLLPTNTQGSGFLFNTQQHCFQGKGKMEEPVQLWCLEKRSPSIQFSQQFCPRL